MQNVVLTVHLILALLLVGVVLLQRSEGRGLGMGDGGGGGGAMSGRQAASALTKLTWVFAVCFIATSITLTILAAQKAGGGSVVEQFGGFAPAETAPLPTTPLGSDLLPPTNPDAPLAPPRIEDAPTAPADGATAPPGGTTAPAGGTAPASGG
jgi:preprotein translocase subunit SecG